MERESILKASDMEEQFFIPGRVETGAEREALSVNETGAARPARQHVRVSYHTSPEDFFAEGDHDERIHVEAELESCVP
jgi:hypothetical protein